MVRLRDVARLELGAQQYDQSCTLDTEPSVALSIYQLPGSNAIKTAKAVYAKMEELKPAISRGRRVQDRLRHHAVHQRIGRRGAQDAPRRRDPGGHRGAGVPAELAGDDHSAGGRARGHRRHLRRHGGHGLQPQQPLAVRPGAGHRHRGRRRHRGGGERRALAGRGPARRRRRPIKAMDEVTGPVIAVALVLCAVFVPCAFISGITGQFFRQFALTIAVSTVISAFNSLTLSPALAAVLLKPHGAQRDLADRR